EPQEEAPLAHLGRIDIGMNFQTLLQKRVDLFELNVVQPEFHILVRPDGTTNFPTPPSKVNKPAEFEISIRNFSFVNGSALINEQRINMDFSLQNLDALFDYQKERKVLHFHLDYDGIFDRVPDVKLAIPYTLETDMDYTRATLLAHQILVRSGGNQAKLQGR